MRRILVVLAFLLSVDGAAWAQTATFNGFASASGDYPLTLLASDGNWYGALDTAEGGVYRISPSGNFTTIASAPGEGYAPQLCFESSDGALYGVEEGGPPIIFKMSLNGALLNVIDLPQGEYYITPACPVLASDGNYYGGFGEGGSYGDGYLYQLTPGGKLTVLYNFTGNYTIDGNGPNGPLVQASDGNFYGVSTQSEGINLEQVFRYSSSLGLTLLPAYVLRPPLIEGADGALYGLQAGQNALDRVPLTGAETTIWTAPSGDTARSFSAETERFISRIR
jgi:hypothetical protein